MEKPSTCLDPQPSTLIDKIIKTEVYKDIQKNKDPLSVVMFNLNEIHVRQRKFGSNIFDNKEKVLLDYFQYMMKPLWSHFGASENRAELCQVVSRLATSPYRSFDQKLIITLLLQSLSVLQDSCLLFRHIFDTYPRNGHLSRMPPMPACWK